MNRSRPNFLLLESSLDKTLTRAWILRAASESALSSNSRFLTLALFCVVLISVGGL
jgi:hypothetical protein